MKAAYWADPEAAREKGRRKYHADPVAGRAQVAKSYQKHRIKRRAAVDAYNEANREKVQQRRRDYYQQKIKTDPAKKLRLRVRARFKFGVAKLLKQGRLNRKFEALFGYTPKELADYIVSKFQPGMTIEDLMAGRIHIDHIKPVSSFNVTGLDCPELRACWALENLQPLWAKDNLRKGARAEWRPADAATVSRDPAHP